MGFKSGYIAILGVPNAGKSTLVNAILKDKIAPVTDKPQTTRKRLKGIYTTESCQMIFLDTPGLHQVPPGKKLNQFMSQEIEEAVSDADVLCYLVSPDQPRPKLLKELYQTNSKRLSFKKSLLVINKKDLLEKEDEKELTAYFGDLPSCLISAKTGEGVDEFLKILMNLLEEGPRLYPEDELTDTHLRELACEIIREKVTQLTYQEIPYSAALEMISFKEDPQLCRIEAYIVVEHDSQKGIIIGQGGGMIKQIGVLARSDLERLIGTQVFLELRVKVDKNWTKNPAKLACYGYPLPKMFLT